MSYNPTQWSAGDTVTSAKLNKMEQGISNSGVLEINAVSDIESGTLHLDKTWQEIYDANGGVILLPSSGLYPYKALIQGIWRENEVYNIGIIAFFNYSLDPMVFTTLTVDGNPVLNSDLAQASDPSDPSTPNAL